MWLFLLLGMVFPTSLFSQEGATKNDAEALFHKMSQKLDLAKSLSVEYTLQFQSKEADFNGNLKGVFRALSGNRIYMTLGGDFKGKKGETKVISDGEIFSTLEVIDGKEHQKKKVLKEDFGKLLVGCFARGGPFLGFRAVSKAYRLKEKMGQAKDYMLISNFSMGKKGKVGDREAQAVTYDMRLSYYKKGEPAKVTLWIDTKTYVPLKRRVVVANRPGDPPVKMIDKYSKWQINGEVDPKWFRIPKVKKGKK